MKLSDIHNSDGGNTITYLGVEAGWRRTKFGSVRESGFMLGPRMGIKYFLSDSITIDTSIIYKFSTDDVFVIDFETTDSYFYPGIGLKALF